MVKAFHSKIEKLVSSSGSEKSWEVNITNLRCICHLALELISQPELDSATTTYLQNDLFFLNSCVEMVHTLDKVDRRDKPPPKPLINTLERLCKHRRSSCFSGIGAVLSLVKTCGASVLNRSMPNAEHKRVEKTRNASEEGSESDSKNLASDKPPSDNSAAGASVIEDSVIEETVIEDSVMEDSITENPVPDGSDSDDSDPDDSSEGMD
jgi:hypothetical protein